MKCYKDPETNQAKPPKTVNALFTFMTIGNLFVSFVASLALVDTYLKIKQYMSTGQESKLLRGTKRVFIRAWSKKFNNYL